MLYGPIGERLAYARPSLDSAFDACKARVYAGKRTGMRTLSLQFVTVQLHEFFQSFYIFEHFTLINLMI